MERATFISLACTHLSKCCCHFYRDGSEVQRDPRSGNVLAEIILKTEGGGRMAALTSYSSPWPLGRFLYAIC